MSRYMTRPVEVEAEQWAGHGTLAEITALPDAAREAIQHRFPTERPRLKVLGWFQDRDKGIIVAPGDWLVTGATGIQQIVKASEFERRYMKVEETQ